MGTLRESDSETAANRVFVAPDGAGDQLRLPWTVFARAADPALIAASGRAGLRIAQANEAFLSLGPYRRDDVIDTDLYALFADPAQGQVVRDLWCRLGGEPLRTEASLRAPGGRSLPVELELIPLLDGDASVRCLIILRDLSNQHSVIAHAAHADERLRLATDVGRIGTWEWHPATGELTWDPWLRMILGVSDAQPASHALWTELVHPLDRARAAEDAESLFVAVDEVDAHYRIDRPDGSHSQVLARTRVSERDEHGHATRLIGVLLDITELQQAADEREILLAAEQQAREVAERASEALARLASNDPLTGLANRHELNRWMRQALSRCEQITVMFFDLDRFKPVNDSYGHTVGDQVLIELAKRLRVHVRESDLVARFGGDEFVVATVVATAAEATELAQRLLTDIGEPVHISGMRVALTASVGLAMSDHGTPTDPDTLLSDADLALYHAKSQGRNRATWFDPRHRDTLTRRMTVESDLRTALDTTQFHLDFRPSFEIASGRLVGAEALLRWQHPRFGLLTSDQFMSIAEESDLIHAVGQWAIADAANHRRQWHALPEDFILFVNASAQETNRAGFAADFLEILAAAPIQSELFGIEVTESLFSTDTVGLRELGVLHDHGVKIALDDFGTGHSSLSRLSRSRIDVIKLDQNFVAELETSASTRAIVATVITLARSLGSMTVAEGVNRPAQLAILGDLGCDRASGDLLGPPTAHQPAPRALHLA